MVPFANPAVAESFAAFPAPQRAGLLLLRELIFDEAATLPQVGQLEEALRWGQPAYLTPQRKSGSTLRLGMIAGDMALFAHCQTTLIRDYAAEFGTLDRIEGNRAVRFANADAIDPDRIRMLIRSGLTYHLPRTAKVTSASV